MRATSGIQRAAVLACLAYASACGDGPAAPVPHDAVEVLAGADQAGLEGMALPDSVILRVVDAAGRGLPGVRVEAEASDGGRVGPPSPVSGPTGRIRLAWTLGPASAPDQALRLETPGGGRATLRARALPEEEGDLVLVRGADGPLKGIVLLHDDLRGADLALEVPTPDTVIRLQPRSDGTGLVVFPTGNPLEWRDVAWTDGPDTVVVELREPVAVDVRVRIHVPPFEARRAQAEADLARTEEMWRKQGFGIRLGDVVWEDRVEAGRSVGVSGDVCAAPAADRIEIAYVHVVNGSSMAGVACAPGQVFMAAEASERYPYLLGHEIGHTFALAHRTPGLMDPSAPTAYVTEGEIFAAHFSNRSGLNVLFGAQPEGARRVCGSSFTSCLTPGYVLGR